MRLNQRQTTVAFQHALEHASTVFGSRLLAEQWLKSPCKHLEDQAPQDLLDNALGFEQVERYLTRIEYGVYQ